MIAAVAATSEQARSIVVKKSCQHKRLRKRERGFGLQFTWRLAWREKGVVKSPGGSY